MQAQDPPGQNLEHFIKGAKAAGQDGKGVGVFGHDALALMHGVDEDQIAHAGMGDFTLVQMARDDPHDLAACVQCAIGQTPHQPDPATAIDQFNAGAAQCPAKRIGFGQEARRDGVR